MSKKNNENKSREKEQIDKEYIPSEKEVINGKKVIDILDKIEGIGYTMHRADLFTVTEPEFGLEITVDAEDNVVCLISNVCEVSHLEKNLPGWQETLLKLNNILVHGKFAISENKILLRENLAAENLDHNELEDAISSMFASIIRNAETLKLT